jgi:hypothetical protein
MQSSFCWAILRVQLLHRIFSVVEAGRCSSANNRIVPRWIPRVRQAQKVRNQHLTLEHKGEKTNTLAVVAAVTFGAVIRSRNQNFTIGDGVSFDGQRARTSSQLAALNKYSDRLRDYCHYGDPMCAVGSNPADVYAHLDYFLEHNEEVVPWIVGKAKGITDDDVQVSHGEISSVGLFCSSTRPPPLPSSLLPLSQPTVLAELSMPNTSTPFVYHHFTPTHVIPY